MMVRFSNYAVFLTIVFYKVFYHFLFLLNQLLLLGAPKLPEISSNTFLKQ